MRGYMFKNRWGAIAFVCLMAFGAANLVGSKEDGGILQSAADKLTQSKDKLSERTAELAEPDERPVIVADPPAEFASDDELFGSDDYLIDNARGSDPVPDLDVVGEMDSYAEDGDVVMIIDNDEIDQ